MTDRLRVFYALGPGDVVDAYRKWSGGIDYTAETSLTFSGQFFDFCKAHGVQAYAVSSHSARELLRDGPFVVENRPKLFSDPHGLLFHLNQIWYGLSSSNGTGPSSATGSAFPCVWGASVQPEAA